MTIFFKSIGVTNEIHLVKVQTSVENLIYSSPGSSIKPLFISDEQFNSFKYINSVDKWGETAHCSKEKVWLSRSKWTTGLVTNEQIIEEDLKKIGYRIVHPENMSLREQVKIISTSKIVSGFDGSQFFTLLFAKNISGKFIVFNRRKYIPATLSYVFQRLNLEYKEYVFDLETNDCNMKIHYPYHNNIIENLNKYA